MDIFEEGDIQDDYVQNIIILLVFISRDLGDKMKKVVIKGEIVNINFDWREIFSYFDERVEYEFWINSNDECGFKCDVQMEFVKDFKGVVQILEKNGYIYFILYYIIWYCFEVFILSKQCIFQCINYGRYCVLDFE